MYRLLSALLTGLMLIPAWGQQPDKGSTYLVRTIAFYNLENLFDTINDSLVHDSERTPRGADRWTEKRLEVKLKNLSRVISGIGYRYGANPPDLMGVCEVENQTLLERLIVLPALKPFHYGIVHHDSPDPRGIDVALLYRKDRFFPLEEKSFRLLLYDEAGNRKYTRDLLVVSGYLDLDLVHIMVNHWPSRGGGARSREHRKMAALRQRSLIDSILYRFPESKIIAMGDFNDNPTDHSLQILTGGRGAKGRPDPQNLFNPLTRTFSKGVGSLAYRDRWSLFDQILFSRAWLFPEKGTYQFWKAGIFCPGYLKVSEGRYRGYPLRTYAGGRYLGGFSDHFPVYAYLIRPLKLKAN